MNIISSTSLAVCWNGVTLSPFTPSRGLYQRDPLSSYLFILCMEVLGQAISEKLDRGEWKSIAISPKGFRISHLFFADDLLLCGEVSFSQAWLEYTLASFSGISRQQVNRGKSRLWLSPKTPVYLKNVICSTFGILPTSDLGMYLWVPLLHSLVRRPYYQFLVDKAMHHLIGWKRKAL